MCGIVGAVASRSVSHLLIDGLKKLEYRGYDSAGLAIIDQDQQLQRLRLAGKVRELEQALNNMPLRGHIGIAHTRWATHGVPSEHNAHPFISHDAFALVHNGIIENHSTLRKKLLQAGYQFHSDTDTEVVVHLIHQHFAKHKDLLKAIRAAVLELEGAYAFAILAKTHPERLLAVRQGCPLVIGLGKGENFIASDPLALLSHTQEFIYLEDHDVADVTLHDIQIYDHSQRHTKRSQHVLQISLESTEKGPYRHFMQKEIMEQPKALAACLSGRMSKNGILPGIFGARAEAIFPNVEHLQLIACGTSFHAAMVARYWYEKLLGKPCIVEVASEFRYRDNAQLKNSLFITLSQSGETADTLAALRLAKTREYLGTLAICNVADSTLTREADFHFLTHAGIEIGVASTKALLTQLVALLLLALTIRGEETAELASTLMGLPDLATTALKQDSFIAEVAKLFIDKQHALFIGRGLLYPVALEGALKMKEISYIHAEGYPGGELKHGPLALVDQNMPIIAAVPGDHLLEKTVSNLHEVNARGGKLLILSDQTAFFQQTFPDACIIPMPTVHPLLTPIIYTIPMQLLAYHVAVLKGTDVDQPRNLAKSVTVE